MKEARENGKELSHSAHADGMNELKPNCLQKSLSIPAQRTSAICQAAPCRVPLLLTV
jgi:hypothetical protein